MAKILIVGGPGDYQQAGVILRKGGHDPVSATTMSAGIEQAKKLPFGSLILANFRIGDKDCNEAPEFIIALRKARINHPVIVYGVNLSSVDVCRAMNGHKAIDYVQQQTFDKELLLKVNRYLPKKGCSFDRTSPYPRSGVAFTNAMDCLSRIAKLDANVMIIGEPGLGKERFARYIHTRSNRADKPLVIINHPDFVTETLSEVPCPACHIRSCFERANGGIVVIKNLHSFCLRGQSLIMAEIESGRYDVRIIATADISIKEKIADGTLNDALMHNAATTTVFIPPLHDNPEDVEPLVRFFLKEFAELHNQPVCQVTPGALDMLRGYSWPLNARELRNTVTQCAAVSTTGRITVSNLQNDCYTDFKAPATLSMTGLDEESRIVFAIRSTPTLKDAAVMLGMCDRTLNNKRRKYSLDAEGNKIAQKVSV